MEFKFNNEKTLDDYIKSGLAVYDKKVGVELYRSNARLGKRVGFEVVDKGNIVGSETSKLNCFCRIAIWLCL